MTEPTNGNGRDRELNGHVPPDEAGAREVLRRLELDITVRLDGLLHGDYRGLVPGHGSEPGETREYAPGDDVRRIDWNVTARLQKTHIRQTIADRELDTRVVVDLSPSLDFGTARCEKRDLVLAGTAAVGFLTARIGNRFGAILARPDGDEVHPVAQGRQHLMAILDRIQRHERLDGGAADLGRAMRHLVSSGSRRGLAVVVSDFLGPAGWQRQLSRVGMKHDLLAIEVVDPRELELPDVGMLSLVDPATGDVRDVQTGRAKLRRRYAEAAQEQRSDIARAIRDAGADHLQLRTDRDWLLDLARFVTLRRKRDEARPPRPGPAP